MPSVTYVDTPPHGHSSASSDYDFDAGPRYHHNGASNSNASRDMLQGAPKAPIAICGMSMRLPGGIRDAETFWDVLINGKDMMGPINPTRYNPDAFTDKMGGRGVIHAQHGYFLDEDLGALDTSFFSMTRSELERADPQQRMLLEVVKEAFDNAGETEYSGKSIGCYVGTFGEDWLISSVKETQHASGMVMTGYGDLMIANRVSYEYNLRGPSLVIKTGCSASLIGLHDACRAIQAGDCNSAIVAGTNLVMGPTTTAAMTSEGILSPGGSCKSFDAAADGFARAESISAVYIKRLDHAIRDRNPIRAVIRNTGTNSDGRSSSLMAPSGEAHEQLMRKVYQAAGLNPAETPFVECHGTGTVTGDPIETKAVGRVFGKGGVYIGSVKPNIGHAEGASGIGSLIKTILSLEHQTIPPQIKFTTPNPNIPFKEMNILVPTAPTPFPESRPQRVSLNSFGIGGANAHAIIESAAPFLPESYSPRSTDQSSKPQLLLYSANTQNSLRNYMDSFHDYNQKYPDRFHDLAYTLAMRRARLPYRAFGILGRDVKHSFSPSARIPHKSLGMVMVFSGQGAQWPRMGADLILIDGDFRKDIRRMDRILHDFSHPPKWSLEEELLTPEATSNIHDAELAQPLCTAVQIALVELLARHGLSPEAVVGHSSGEIAAAYAAGTLTLRAALVCSYYRGYVTKSQTLKGSMAAVGLGAEVVRGLLVPGVVVACENSPKSTTISGDSDAVTKVVEAVKKVHPDTLARVLKVNMAYHSHHMIALGRKYHSLVEEELNYQPDPITNPRVPFYSSVYERTLKTAKELGASYWEANLISPVLFGSAVFRIIDERSENLFVEIGPHSTLEGPLRQVLSTKGAPLNYVPTMLRNKHCYQSYLSALGLLFQHGVSVQLERLVGDGKVLTDVPHYAWDHHESFWYESRVSSAWRFRKHGYHSLLGLRVPESPDNQPLWRNVLHLQDEPWLNDHMIGSDVVFPFAGYLTMAGEAVRQISGECTGFTIKNAVALTALVLDEKRPVEITTSFYPVGPSKSPDSTYWSFSISSYSGSSWVKHFEGQIATSDDSQHALEPEPLLRPMEKKRWYEAIADVGLVYGPEFQGLADISSSVTECSAVSTVVVPEHQLAGPFILHPAAIDSCFQLLLVAMAKGSARNLGKLSIPTRIDELTILPGSDKMKAAAWIGAEGDSGIQCVANGKVAMSLRGLHLTPLGGDDAGGNVDKHAAARLHWHPHFEFIDHTKLFEPPQTDPEVIRLMEEMTLLCIIDSAERLKGLKPCQPHWAKFDAWLDQVIQQAADNTYPLVENSRCWLEIPKQRRVEMIHDLDSRLKKLAVNSSVPEGIRRIWANVEDIFVGKRDTLDILMEGDVLTEIYNAVSMGHSGFMHAISSTKPDLRILEVGAGTGGTTQTFLRDLVDESGTPKYAKYTFTDISAGFFVQAKERFSYAHNMEYKVFDISKSPFDQNFEQETYDLIIAPNVVHATENLNTTLGNLQSLLRKGGRLVLTELCAEARTPNYIFGNFSGWWLGGDDNRYWQPYISVDRWDTELKAAGFKGVDSAILDAPKPFTYCAAIVSERVYSEAIQDKSISLLARQPLSAIGSSLQKALEIAGYTVIALQVGEPVVKGQSTLAIIDLEEPFFESISPADWIMFQKTLRSANNEKFLWLTAPSQLHAGKNPSHAHAPGFGRTIRSELGIAFCTLEINASEPKLNELTMKVFGQVETSEDQGIFTPDYEFAVSDGVVHISRYHPFKLSAEANTFSPVKTDDNSSPPDILEATGKPITFRDDASYLVTGGTGGLGTSLVTWMAERGARSVVLISRSAGTKPSDQALAHELSALGCKTTFVAGHSENVADLDRAVSCAPLPIGGVIHLAMVLKDANIKEMTYEDWSAVNEIKAGSAWNLHKKFSGVNSSALDFFVIASSFSAVIGHPGQGNYNSASTYLEAFTQWRRAQGLPCSIINISPVSGVGYLAENAKARKNMKAEGLYFLGEQEFLDYIELCIRQSTTSSPDTDSGRDNRAGFRSTGQIIMGLRSEVALHDPSCRTAWRRDRRMAIYHNVYDDSVGATKAEADELAQFLTRAADEPEMLQGSVAAAAFFADQIAKVVCDFMLKPKDESVDLGMSPTALGLDSLIAIEVRRWWKQVFKFEVSVLEITTAGTLLELGTKAAQGVYKRLSGV